MRKLAMGIIVASFILAGLVCADEIASKRVSASYTTNITAKITADDVGISGFVEEIRIEMPLTTATNYIEVSAIPLIGDPLVLASNVVSADLVVRPRVKTTGIGGVAGSTDTKFLLRGETIRLSVTNVAGSAAMSNRTFNVDIKTSNSGGQ